MPVISASVGKRGQNDPVDVEVVQKLLNRHSLPPLRRLKVTGRADRDTIATIEHFQSAIVGLRSPDGRVDPRGKTLRALRRNPSSEPAGGAKGAFTAEERKAFVKSSVKEKPNTKRIIDALVPHFRGVNARVISGYMNDAGQFWKVNYHWELLLWQIDHSLTLPVDEKYKKALKAIRSVLLRHKPSPSRGYRTSSRVGTPEDKSDPKKMVGRYKAVKQSKKDFKTVVEKAKILDLSSRSDKSFYLAYAPVARPGTSKHGSGAALDIAGENSRIKKICKGLGATLVFDEGSHVHVEFLRGVR